MRYESKPPIKTSTMNTIKIGEQEWATEDLKVTKFRNGEDIPLVKYNTKWATLETAAYYISPNGSHLYNWFAVNDPRGLAPEGFHVPSDEEWTELTERLGGKEIAGERIKVSSWDGTNSSGFSALPGGYRSGFNGRFFNLARVGGWWSSSRFEFFACACYLYSGNSVVGRGNTNVRSGFSVRCLKTL